MGCRIKWGKEHIERVSSEWDQVISATEPKSPQIDRVGALIVADRALEYLVDTINPSHDQTGKKLTVLEPLVPDFRDLLIAREVRNNAAHRVKLIHQKWLLFALLEYQRAFEALGIALEEEIPLETVRRNGSPMLRKYLD